MLEDKVSVALLKVNAMNILFKLLYIEACHSSYLCCIISWHDFSLSKVFVLPKSEVHPDFPSGMHAVDAT